MSPSDLRTLFGAATPAVLIVLLAILLVFMAIGLRQGREIFFWPLRLGPPPVPPATPAVEAPAPAAPVSPPEQPSVSVVLPAPSLSARSTAAGRVEDTPADYDELYEVDRADEFYQEIAGVYDGRNSGDLVATHLATISRINALLAAKPTLKVADLGGGTGNPIATAFYAADAVAWTYVDVCPGMEAQFRRNLNPHPLGRKVTIECGDFRRVCYRLPAGAYDVVLLSLVLTSMPELPDFRDIARLLAPGGQLIVTDVGPGYTRLKPFYEVRVGNRLLALRTVPVDPLEVARQAANAGLTSNELTPLGDGETYYSFVGSFAAGPVTPSSPLGDEAVAAE
jgi:SAM-dependent methyltransferase